MKLVVVLDGERHEVDVDLGRSRLRVGAHEWPYLLVAADDASVTFELLGERIEVQDDLATFRTPGRSVVVNGELHTLEVESTAGTNPPPSAGLAPSTARGRETDAPGMAQEGPGRAISAPMPGKILEVRVREGDRVAAGQVLFVLEAMKMRNEVTSPVAGKVSGLRVTSGANVAARDVLLRVVPV